MPRFTLRWISCQCKLQGVFLRLCFPTKEKKTWPWTWLIHKWPWLSLKLSPHWAQANCDHRRLIERQLIKQPAETWLLLQKPRVLARLPGSRGDRKAWSCRSTPDWCQLERARFLEDTFSPLAEQTQGWGHFLLHLKEFIFQLWWRHTSNAALSAVYLQSWWERIYYLGFIFTSFWGSKDQSCEMH